jgi:competence protein ComEC
LILFYAAACFLAGAVAAALEFGAGWPILALSGAGVAAGCLLAGRRRDAALAGLLTLALLGGVERYEAARPQAEPGGVALLNDLADASGEPAAVQLRGRIVDEPEERETTLRCTVEVAAYRDAEGAWQAAPGRVLVTARPYPLHVYGELVELTGRLESPPLIEGFDYREYLARRGVVSTMLFPGVEIRGLDPGDLVSRLLRDGRATLSASLEQTLPEPESALARGILLGQRAAIPAEVMDEFNRAGISHLIAISGQNVVLVAGFIVAMLASALGRRPATVMAILVVLVYAVFVGASPSVLRAAVMATVMLGAVLAGRPAGALPGVVLAGAVLVAHRPLLIEDVSFQLSFAATLGIVLGAERLRAILLSWLAPLPRWLAGFLAENLAITSAASLTVLPVIAATFGRVSIVSLPANLLAAPAFVLALVGAALTAGAGCIDTGLGRAVAEIARLPLAYLIGLADLAAALPMASVEVRAFGILEALIAFALLAVAYFVLRRLPLPETEPVDRRPASPVLALAALVALAAALTWWSAIQPEGGRLRVTVLDVGQGDAILIETPAGARILVDGGPSGPALLQALGRRLPAGERRVDLIVLTHAQDDHLTGFVELLQRFDVGAALAGPLAGESGAYLAWREALDRRRVPLLTAAAGQTIDLGDGALLNVLGPPSDASTAVEDPNDHSVVLRLRHGAISVLLTGDLGAEGEAALLASGADLRSTVLKVGHHGSDGSSTPAFLDAVAPELAVISAGARNVYGHPSPTTRLRLASVPLLRTDLNGDVSFETDGTRLWVSFERGDYAGVQLGALR